MKLQWSLLKLTLDIPDHYFSNNNLKLLEENYKSSTYSNGKQAVKIILINNKDCSVENLQNLMQHVHESGAGLAPKIFKEQIIDNVILEDTQSKVKLYVIYHELMDITLDTFIQHSKTNQSISDFAVQLAFIANQFLIALQKSSSSKTNNIFENPAYDIFSRLIYLQKTGRAYAWLPEYWDVRDFGLNTFVKLNLEKKFGVVEIESRMDQIIQVIYSKLPEYIARLQQTDQLDEATKSMLVRLAEKPAAEEENHQEVSSAPTVITTHWNNFRTNIQILNKNLGFEELNFLIYMDPFGVYQYRTQKTPSGNCLIGLEKDRREILQQLSQFFPKIKHVVENIPTSHHEIRVFIVFLEDSFSMNLLDYYRSFVGSVSQKIERVIQRVDQDKLSYGMLSYLKKSFSKELDVIVDEFMECAVLLVELNRICIQLVQFLQNPGASRMTSLVSNVNLYNALLSEDRRRIFIVGMIRTERAQRTMAEIMDACQFNIFDTFQSILRNTNGIQQVQYLVEGILYLFYDKLKLTGADLDKYIDPQSEGKFTHVHARMKRY